MTINNICKETGKGIGPNLRARFAEALGVPDTDLTSEQLDVSGGGEYRGMPHTHTHTHTQQATCHQ